MPDYRTMFDSDYVASWDLNGDVTVTIEKVEAGEVQNREGGKQRKPVIHFTEAKKPLVGNKTNCKTIAAMYGKKTEDWKGKKITLYATTCEGFGDVLDCIRVRPEVPK